MTSSNDDSTAVIPQPPFDYAGQSTNDERLLDVTDITTTITEQEEKRQEAYDLSRQFHAAIIQAKQQLEQTKSLSTATSQATDLDSFLQKIIPTPTENGNQEEEASSSSSSRHHGPRPANLSQRMEEYVRYRAYQNFLQTGRLIAPSAFSTGSDDFVFVSDEEYLAGACMGLTQDLQRYGLGRATCRDASSVALASQLVTQVNEYLLGFDFRNGPLRRKYDSVKYSVKALETLLYELAITGTPSTREEEQDTAEHHKRQKLDSSASLTLLPMDELDALRLRVAHRDELRESLIKKSRDGQKAAKQAIYALHRGDVKRSTQLLEQCRDCLLTQLFPIVEQDPMLRQSGSLSGVLEEYVEAELFATWLYGPDRQDSVGGTSTPSGILRMPADFDGLDLQVEEYLGGLCDLTGEIGRFAVQRGTARDKEGIQLCLETNSKIWHTLQSMERLPSSSSGGGVGKKMDQLRRSVEKLERMMYEMSLSEATGRRNAIQSSSMEEIMDIKNGRDDGE